MQILESVCTVLQPQYYSILFAFSASKELLPDDYELVMHTCMLAEHYLSLPDHLQCSVICPARHLEKRV